MNNQEKNQILLDILNKFAKHEASLQELTEFGVAFIINAAKLTGFPSSGAETLINEVDYQLRIGVLSIKNENENDQRCS